MPTPADGPDSACTAPIRETLRETLRECSLPAALEAMGERWELCAPAFPILVDARDRRPIAPVAVQAHDGRILGKGDLIWALPEDVDDPT